MIGADYTRREWLAGSALLATAATLGGCARPVETRLAGALDGAALGEPMASGPLPPVTGPVEQVGILIAGGGAAGLAAGWRLTAAGFNDFAVIERAAVAGGHCRTGHNAALAFPLGAQRLAVPNREATALQVMLAQFGTITSRVARRHATAAHDDPPRYDPAQLAPANDRRVLWQGHWHDEDALAQVGSALDSAQLRAFAATMAQLAQSRGADGRPAFALPMAYASRDPAWLALDRQTFAQWLRQQGWTSPLLTALVRHRCRERYGTEPAMLSAWAGILAFAGQRSWLANDSQAPGVARDCLWSEGTGHLVARMAQDFRAAIHTSHSVLALRPDDGAVLVDVHDHARGVSRRWRAGAVVVALPQTVARRLGPVPGPVSGGHGTFGYTPWAVAVVTTSRAPAGAGAALAGSNAVLGRDGIGYRLAPPTATGHPQVLLWDVPLSHLAPDAARALMASRDLAGWQAEVRAELLAIHPELDGAITRIDLWRWGQAMVRPAPGFLTDPARLAAERGAPPLFAAHSDVSGLSSFAEAHYRGVMAAEAALGHLGQPVSAPI